MSVADLINRQLDKFSKLDKPWKRLLYLAVSTAIGGGLGILLGIKILLPLLCSLPAYLLMIYLLKSGSRGAALRTMLIWALMLGILMTMAGYFFPAEAENVIIKSTQYKNEMFEWIKTGIGAEGNPGVFIPQHMLHLTIFVILSLITMSFLSIYFGAVLMNYMAFYVAQLLLNSDQKLIMFLLGWHFWSLFRIAGFVILGVVLSELSASRLFKYDWSLKRIKVYLIVAFSLIILDIITKALFAPAIGSMIKPMLM